VEKRPCALGGFRLMLGPLGTISSGNVRLHILRRASGRMKRVHLGFEEGTIRLEVAQDRESSSGKQQGGNAGPGSRPEVTLYMERWKG